MEATCSTTGATPTLNVSPSIDTIAEVRVLTCNYGARYGRNGSATIEVETKSGTSTFHGDIYEFVRNDVFNARNYLDPPGHRPHTRNTTSDTPWEARS